MVASITYIANRLVMNSSGSVLSSGPTLLQYRRPTTLQKGGTVIAKPIVMCSGFPSLGRRQGSDSRRKGAVTDICGGGAARRGAPSAAPLGGLVEWFCCLSHDGAHAGTQRGVRLSVLVLHA